MRRVRLTEEKLHRIIKHAINEAIESNEEGYILKGVSIRWDDSDEMIEWNDESINDSKKTVGLFHQGSINRRAY